jgi:hypothetical protein
LTIADPALEITIPMMDSDNHIFEPDVVLSSELFAPRTGVPSAERALMIAVLEDAARCFLRPYDPANRKQHALYEEARDWFLSSEHSRLFDFETVCAVLGIDAAWLRRRMFALRSPSDTRDAPTADDADEPPAADVA